MFWKLLRKDFRVFFSDPTSVTILLLMPIVLSSILSMALSGAFEFSVRTDPVKIAIVREYDKKSDMEAYQNLYAAFSKSKTEDLPDPEKIFFQDFLGNEEIKELIQYQILTEEQAKKALEKEQIYSIFYLPERFQYDLLVNMTMPYRNKINLAMEGNENYQIRNQMVQSIIQGFFEEMTEISVSKNILIEEAMTGKDTEKIISKITEVLEKRDAKNQELSFSEQNVGLNKMVTSVQYYTLGMLAMFMLFTAGGHSYELLKEKREKTYQREIVAGISFSKILMSQYVSTVLFLLLQQVLLFTFSKLVFGSDFGDPIRLALFSMISAISMAGLSLLLTVISFVNENYAISSIFQNILIYVLALLGGSYLPLEVMPEMVQKIGPYILNGAILKVFLQNATGAEFSKIVPYLIGLLIQGTVFFVAAMVLLKTKRGVKDV